MLTDLLLCLHTEDPDLQKKKKEVIRFIIGSFSGDLYWLVNYLNERGRKEQAVVFERFRSMLFKMREEYMAEDDGSAYLAANYHVLNEIRTGVNAFSLGLRMGDTESWITASLSSLVNELSNTAFIFRNLK